MSFIAVFLLSISCDPDRDKVGELRVRETSYRGGRRTEEADRQLGEL